MQTFLTDWPTLGYGFRDLDYRRLVKQSLETRQIMAALAGTTKGWVNHPATRMWYGKEDILFNYAEQNSRELINRGYKWEGNYYNTVSFYSLAVEQHDTDGVWDEAELDRVIYTHRGRLYEKDPLYYAQWSNFTDFKKYVCCERCNYYWPTHIWEKV